MTFLNDGKGTGHASSLRVSIFQFQFSFSFSLFTFIQNIHAYISIQKEVPEHLAEGGPPVRKMCERCTSKMQLCQQRGKSYTRKCNTNYKYSKLNNYKYNKNTA